MWDATPGAATPGRDTPAHDKSSRRNRWDETPKTERETPGHSSGWAETPRTDRTGADLIQETPTPGASKRRFVRSVPSKSARSFNIVDLYEQLSSK